MYKRVIWFLGFVYFLTACQVDELVSEKQPGGASNPIWLQGGMAETYAGGSESVDDLLSSVGLYAYNGSNQARYDNQRFSSSDSVLSATSNPQYWLFDETLTFYAYAPHRSISNPEAVPLTVENNQTASIKNSDFLYASQSGVTYFNWDTPAKKLSFTHCLSKINVNLVRTPGNTFVTVADMASSSVKILNTITNGQYNLKAASNRFSLGSTRGDILSNPFTTAETGYEKSFQAIVMPQTVQNNGNFLEIMLGTKKYTYKLAQPYTFESGKAYTFNITVDISEIILNVSETPWVQGSSGTGARIKYKVKDYFPYPNEPSKATGVVFKINNPDANGYGYSGMVVSLTQASLKWRSSGSVDNGYCRHEDDGRKNVQDILNRGGVLTNYPAFVWCYNYGNDIGETGLWYLPASDEFDVLRRLTASDRAGFNAILTAAPGGVAFISSTSPLDTDYYWTSYSGGILIANSQAIHMSINGTGPGLPVSKSGEELVRAIRRFDNS